MYNIEIFFALVSTPDNRTTEAFRGLARVAGRRSSDRSGCTDGAMVGMSQESWLLRRAGWYQMCRVCHAVWVRSHCVRADLHRLAWCHLKMWLYWSRGKRMVHSRPDRKYEQDLLLNPWTPFCPSDSGVAHVSLTGPDWCNALTHSVVYFPSALHSIPLSSCCSTVIIFLFPQLLSIHLLSCVFFFFFLSRKPVTFTVISLSHSPSIYLLAITPSAPSP